MKSNKDVKFIIYQVLYIFVVCVVAIKGADLNLVEVLDSTQAVHKSYADSLKKMIDSMTALGLVPDLKWDTNKKFTDVDMNKILADFNAYKVKYKYEQPPVIPDPIIPEEKKIDKERTFAKVQGIELTQYTRPKIVNPYDKPLEIYGDGKMLANISVGGSAILNLSGESSIKFKVGDNYDIKPTKQNLTPKVDIQKVASMTDETSVRRLQGVVGFRVTIIDDFIGNLDVKISGQIKVVQVKAGVFDITLQMFASEVQFDNWCKGKNEPYKVSFTVNIRDKYNSNINISQIGIFQFGKW